MPYDIEGWVEATRIPPEEHDDVSLWMPVLSLDFFCIRGDLVSEYRFGLAKRPQRAPCFAERGVPRDCSPIVERYVAKNKEHIARYGEGDVGHTFASLAEVDAALSDPQAPALNGSSWGHVLAVTRFVLDDPLLGVARYCRFIVWANW